MGSTDRKKTQLSDEDVFRQAAIRGAIPDKDGLQEALDKLNKFYKQCGVPRRSRIDHQGRILKQFETGTPRQQNGIIHRILSIVNWENTLDS